MELISTPTGPSVFHAGGYQTPGDTSSGTYSLIAGGGNTYNWNEATTSCLLFDPATGALTPTGSLHYARQDSAGTRLSDGRVLVAGGSDYASGPTAEIYDPSTGTWTLTGPMSQFRRFQALRHAVQPLASGRAIAVGGLGPSGWVGSAEVYDPTTNSWMTTSAIPNQGQTAVVATLEDGTVMQAILDGSKVNVYDPTTALWLSAPAMLSPEMWGTGVLLPSGDLLVTAGSNMSNGAGHSQIYTDAAMPTTLSAHPVLAETSGPTVYMKPSATLQRTSPTAPLSGKAVTFFAGTTEVCTALTDVNGLAECSGAVPLIQATLSLGFTASFAGDGSYLPSNAKGSLIQ